MSKEIYGAVDTFINTLFVKEDKALTDTRDNTVKENLPAISVSPNQGMFLHILAKLKNPHSILEIGTLGGYSTIWLARALEPEGHITSLELDEHHANVARKNLALAGLDTASTILVGDALKTLPKLVEAGQGPYDVIFIDADKEPYAQYFEWALKLSRSGTLIIADNVVREGDILNHQTTDPQVKGVQQFIQALAASDKVTATIFQSVGTKYHDGMALAIVK